VGLTGNVVKEDIMYFIDHGAVEVLTKPLKVASLKDMMKRLFYISSKGIELDDSPSSFGLSQRPVQELPRKNSSRKIMLVTDNSSPGASPNSLTLAEEAAKDTINASQNDPPSSSFENRRLVYETNRKSGQNNEHLSTTNQNNNILVVDDVASTRKVICRLLKNCGCVFKEAADGQECLDMVAKENPPFDLILMDFEMPVMNGPTATNKLRELGCKIPVVGVTGNVLKADTDFFKKQGALEVLHKPLNVRVVKALLSRHLQSFSTFMKPISFRNAPSINHPAVLSNAKEEELKSDDENVDNEWYMMALNV
jgi:CheY-like chemotaxis protein